MNPHAFRAEFEASLAPVDLRLLAGCRLEAALRQVRQGCCTTQWPHGVARRFIAALIVELLLQLLEQNAGRVVHLRRSHDQPALMDRQQGGHWHLPPVWRPLLLAQPVAHCLAVQLQQGRNRRNRLPLRVQLDALLPTFLEDHSMLRVRLRPE